MSRIFQCLVTFTAGILLLAGASFYIDASGQTPWRSVMRETGPEFFKTAEARRVGDQLLLWQRNTGGWPKNIDMASPMSDSLVAAVLRDKTRRDDSTIDNDATSMQMYFLARLYKATGDDKYRQAFGRGISYLLSGQYKNGGWPQFWPVMTSYQPNITFNDNAIANTLGLFAQVRDRAQCDIGHLGTLLQHHCVMHGLGSILTPGKGSVVFDKDARSMDRIDALEPAHYHVSGLKFILPLYFSLGHVLSTGHSVVKIIRVRGTYVRQVPARLGPGRGIGGMGMNHSAYFRKSLVQHHVRRSIRRWVKRAFNDISVKVHHNHVLRFHGVIAHP